MKKAVLIFLTLLVLLAVAACSIRPPKDPNAVLTDSDLPLDVGAEIHDLETQPEITVVELFEE